jgi:alkylhydroperoxidase family enzyme
LDERTRAALEFLEKLVTAPQSVDPSAMEQLKSAGIARKGAEDLVVICFGFSVINRLAEAFGFETPGGAISKEANFAWHVGYRLASGTWLRVARHPSLPSGIERLVAAAIESPGALTTQARCAIYGGGDFPEPLRTYLAAVREACAPPQGQERLLAQAGYSEDQIFEAAVCAATAEATRRLQAGLRATGTDWVVHLPCGANAPSLPADNDRA